MTISVFDLYAIGVGPSSSHSVGPMRAANQFVHEIPNPEAVRRVQLELFGSLALTGQGHGVHNAVIAGITGALPESVDVDWYRQCHEQAVNEGAVNLLGKYRIPFKADDCLWHFQILLDYHVNGMRFTALDADNTILYQGTYYSVGGGFVVKDGDLESAQDQEVRQYPYNNGEALLAYCQDEKASISDIIWANERAWRTDDAIQARCVEIWEAMNACIEKGLHTDGILPGGLNVRRRAKQLYQQLNKFDLPPSMQDTNAMQWLNVYAMAVNEENAACDRMVTAPTNGAAGVIPAVLRYYLKTNPDASDQTIARFILTAGGIGILYKKNASISGAEVGCQGEVGVACSMAAAGLTEVLGGSPAQVEHAAEMAMEHHLGLTCDPVKGLVQIPCIERNGMAAVRAVNVALLALMEDGEHLVSLDKVIKTMWETGKDMASHYKETSQGGLAVNVIEC